MISLIPTNAKVKKVNKATTTRKFFRKLWHKVEAIDSENRDPVSRVGRVNDYFDEVFTQEEQEVMTNKEVIALKKSLEKDLNGLVVIELTAREFKHLAVDYLGVVGGSWILRELIVGEAVGCYNFQLPGMSERIGFESKVRYYVTEEEWELFYNEFGIMFELLSKKNKMDDERYLAIATKTIQKDLLRWFS